MDNGNINEQASIDKVVNFFKRHIYNLLLVLISALFLFKDVVKIEETGKTITQIIASSFISFVIGMSFNVILGKKGILAGKNTTSFIEAMNRYNVEINKTDNYIDKLDDFCDFKNEQKIKKAQIKVLRTERIKYDDFINKTMEEVCTNERMVHCWEKATKVKIQYLTADNLLSETDERYENGKKELTLNEYERNQNVKDSLVKVVFALIFGYFTVSYVGNFETVIWGAIQISCWLILAMVKYLNNYFYVTDVYKSKIHRKINYLIEFNGMVRKGENNEFDSTIQ